MKKQLIYKVIVWRIFSTLVAGTVSWIWIGELKKSITLTIFLTFLMMFLHYIFERIWESVYK